MPDTCSTCKHWMRLRPGHAGICGQQQQRRREWKEGMAVTGEDDTCHDHKAIRLTDSTPMWAGT